MYAFTFKPCLDHVRKVIIQAHWQHKMTYDTEKNEKKTLLDEKSKKIHI